MFFYQALYQPLPGFGYRREAVRMRGGDVGFCGREAGSAECMRMEKRAGQPVIDLQRIQ
ncbi:hypothetical protein KNP414_00720 [Paenibacillus mucilaginosus KNP414]|uniref:Uncharacterized protein n=1 Tax=Paenibacillus mucilaginosus (strain KNP414) TaxID=1036673 RepID=F8FR60_PAEMK|nr:hypothetical protein KNP414_00720 [Paenibacillus mucilaginosus KNP414]